MGSRIQLQQRYCSRVSRDFSRRSTDQTRKELHHIYWLALACSSRFAARSPLSPRTRNQVTKRSSFDQLPARSLTQSPNFPSDHSAGRHLRLRSGDFSRQRARVLARSQHNDLRRRARGGGLRLYILKANQPYWVRVWQIPPSSYHRSCSSEASAALWLNIVLPGQRAPSLRRNSTASSPRPNLRLLWKSLGFAVAGRLPGAFHHRELCFVDVYIMLRSFSRIDRARAPRAGAVAACTCSLRNYLCNAFRPERIFTSWFPLTLPSTSS